MLLCTNRDILVAEFLCGVMFSFHQCLDFGWPLGLLSIKALWVWFQSLFKAYFVQDSRLNTPRDLIIGCWRGVANGAQGRILKSFIKGPVSLQRFTHVSWECCQLWSISLSAHSLWTSLFWEANFPFIQPALGKKKMFLKGKCLIHTCFSKPEVFFLSAIFPVAPLCLLCTQLLSPPPTPF